jgi:hypothetical protein
MFELHLCHLRPETLQNINAPYVSPFHHVVQHTFCQTTDMTRNSQKEKPRWIGRECAAEISRQRWPHARRVVVGFGRGLAMISVKSQTASTHLASRRLTKSKSKEPCIVRTPFHAPRTSCAPFKLQASRSKVRRIFCDDREKRTGRHSH